MFPSLCDAIKLQKLTDSFRPTTVAEHRDMMTCKLAVDGDLLDTLQVSVLK